MDKSILHGKQIIVNKKKVGKVLDAVLYKEIHGEKHIMRTPHAIFFDVSSLREAESYGAKLIHITDKDNGDIYTASLSDVWQYAIYQDKGYGKQVGLAVNKWTVTHSGGGSTMSGVTGYESPTEISFAEYYKKHPTKAEKQAGQLGLFGGGE